MVQITKIPREFIKDNSITTEKFAADSVTEEKLGIDSIGTNNIQNSAGSTNKIVDDSFTNEKIFDGAIGTAQIEDNSITPEKLEDDGFPVGGIVIFGGTIPEIPSGWGLCDGTSGTPNMRNMFVVGAGDDYALEATGGSDTQTTTAEGSHFHSGASSIAGSHNHGGTTGTHSLTGAEMPAHRHMWIVAVNTSSSIGSPYQGVTSSRVNGAYPDEYGLATVGTAEPNVGYSGLPVDVSGNAVSTGAGHAHAINTDGAHSHGVTLSTAVNHTHTVDVRPRYYALAFIMRIS